MCSSTIPPSLETAIALCRKETRSNSKLCRDRKVRKPPTYKNPAVKFLPAICFCRQRVRLCRLLFLRMELLPVSLAQPYNRRMDNKSLARILRDTAQLLEIDGAIIGRYRSYEKAAELISGMHESIDELAKDPDKLEELPGIGERMAEHLQEILKTGDYGLRQKLLKKYPVTLLDVLHLQSLGPKKVAFLWSNFRAATVADVEKLAVEGKLRDLPGFGEKSEQNILRAVE